MIPFLTYPLALLALAAVPTLAAIYLLRNRFRRRQVSSLMLWRFHIQSKEGGAKVQRIQLPLVFFLELLALLLLVTAATGPRWNVPQTTRPLIVVLDDSLSMRATVDGKSTRDRAIAFLERQLEAYPPPSIRLLLAGTKPHLLGTSARGWSEVNEALSRWTCWASMSAIDDAIVLAAELGDQQANILVLTDHAPEDPQVTGDRLEWHALGRPLNNTAFVNASRSEHGDQDRCLLEVANHSAHPITTELSVRAQSNRIQNASVTIAARERQKVVFNIPSAAPLLTASLENDALSADNQVQLLPPVRKRVRVQIILPNESLSSLVSRTLDATGLRAAISESPELIIHPSTAAAADTNAWSLSWPAVTNATAYTGPFVIDAAHPLAQGVGLQGVVWAADAVTNKPGSVPIIMAGNIPLLSAREDALGRQLLTLNLDTELSTFQNTPDWPVLFWNLLQWRASETPGLRESNARLGTEVLFKTTGEPVEVTWPDQSEKTFPNPGGELLLETPLPGLYSIVMGNATYSLAVNPLATDESNLSHCSTGKWGQWKDDEQTRFEYASVLWLFVLGALIVMAAHLLLVTGRGGGA